MRRIAIVLAALSLGACRSDPGTVSRPRTDSSARVVRSAFSVGSNQVGTGAVIRSDHRAVRAIKLRVAFYVSGRRVGTEEDVLRFCPAATDCLWGQSVFGDRLTKDWRQIDRVEVDVIGDGGAYRDTPRMRRLAVDVRTDGVALDSPGAEGTVYLLALKEGTPEFGYSFFAKRNDHSRLRYGTKQFAVPEGDHVIAVFYPGPVPAGVYGPAD